MSENILHIKVIPKYNEVFTTIFLKLFKMLIKITISHSLHFNAIDGPGDPTV
jgi:hypothetical protein